MLLRHFIVLNLFLVQLSNSRTESDKFDKNFGQTILLNLFSIMIIVIVKAPT